MVIAIIAILAALLVPALRGARERVRRVVCLSQERQIYLAVMGYHYDNRMYYPPYVIYMGDSALQDSWDGFIEPYLGYPMGNPWVRPGDYYTTPQQPIPRDLFVCPSDVDNKRVVGLERSYSRLTQDATMEPNVFFYNYLPQKQLRLIGSASPSSKALLGEWHVWCNIRRMNWPGNFVNKFAWINAWQANIFPAMSTTHFGEGANFTFFDGHAKWVRAKDAAASDLWW